MTKGVAPTADESYGSFEVTMSAIPPISTSASNALQSGFHLADRGAAEIVSATQTPDTPTDTVDVRPTGSAIEAEPLLSGIRDLMLARIQVKAGAALLHAYSDNRQTLFDMLK